jgi:hypothetical protein
MKVKQVVSTPLSASELLNKFLQENKIRLNTSIMDSSTPFVGDGFVLVDKPLLKITAEYINA